MKFLDYLEKLDEGKTIEGKGYNYSISFDGDLGTNIWVNAQQIQAKGSRISFVEMSRRVGDVSKDQKDKFYDEYEKLSTPLYDKFRKKVDRAEIEIGRILETTFALLNAKAILLSTEWSEENGKLIDSLVKKYGKK
jgi:hypothetical protein